MAAEEKVREGGRFWNVVRRFLFGKSPQGAQQHSDSSTRTRDLPSVELALFNEIEQAERECRAYGGVALPAPPGGCGVTFNYEARNAAAEVVNTGCFSIVSDPATGRKQILWGQIETLPPFRRKGLAESVVAKVRALYPDTPIVPVNETIGGMPFWAKVRGRLAGIEDQISSQEGTDLIRSERRRIAAISTHST
ncbi:hypothetical protein LFL97_09970 [Burkholderia sp. JSH-S8]|nr:hypothetical protein LFL97_09970 [Burkholderia sp. JSH-S8]